MGDARAAVARLVAEVGGCTDSAAVAAFADYLCALRRVRGAAATPQLDEAVWQRLALTPKQFADVLLRFNDALAEQ